MYSSYKIRLGRTATMEEWAEELAELDGAEGLVRKMRDMKAARERMISCNLRLVLHIARRKFYTGKSGTLKVRSFVSLSKIEMVLKRLKWGVTIGWL